MLLPKNSPLLQLLHVFWFWGSVPIHSFQHKIALLRRVYLKHCHNWNSYHNPHPIITIGIRNTTAKRGNCYISCTQCYELNCYVVKRITAFIKWLVSSQLGRLQKAIMWSQNVATIINSPSCQGPIYWSCESRDAAMIVNVRISHKSLFQCSS